MIKLLSGLAYVGLVDLRSKGTWPNHSCLCIMNDRNEYMPNWFYIIISDLILCVHQSLKKKKRPF